MLPPPWSLCTFSWHVTNFSLCNKTRTIESPRFALGKKHVSEQTFMQLKFEDDGDICLQLLSNYGSSCLVTTGTTGAAHHYRYSCLSHRNEIIDQGIRILCDSTKRSEDICQKSESNFDYDDTETFIFSIISMKSEAKNVTFEEAHDLNHFDICTLMDMYDLFREQTLADVSIRVQDRVIRSHKAILYARSKFFREIFTRNPNKSEFEFPDFDYDTLKAVIGFLYSGNPQDIHSKIIGPRLSECVEKLGVDDLKVFLEPQKVEASSEIIAEECDYSWIINDFSLRERDKPVEIEFSEKSYRWKFLIFPCGIGNDSVDVTVAFTSYDPFSAIKESPVQLKVRISLVDANGQLCHSRQKMTFLASGAPIKFNPFISRETIMNEKSNLLPEDTLTVHFSLKYSEGHCETVAVRNILSNKSSLWESSPDSDENFAGDLRKLYEEHKFNDATVVVGNERFPVHRAVLAGRSSVFSRMFVTEMAEKETGEIDIRDAESSLVEMMLKHMYCFKLEVSPRTVFDLYSLANRYVIFSLHESCTQFLTYNLCAYDSEFVFEILITSDMFSHTFSTFLKDFVVDFISCNTDRFMNSEIWEEFISEYPNLAKEVLKRHQDREYRLSLLEQLR